MALVRDDAGKIRGLITLEDVLEAHVPESVMTNLPAFSYRKRLDHLAAPSWFVDIFQRYLDTDPRPPLDKAGGRPISTRSRRKRARDQDKLEPRILGMKSQRLSDGSGSRRGS